jgi:hypothetical protein
MFLSNCKNSKVFVQKYFDINGCEVLRLVHHRL